MLYPKKTIKWNATSQAYFFVPDQSHKQDFEMRFCSETVFLRKLTEQIFIFIDSILKLFRCHISSVEALPRSKF